MSRVRANYNHSQTVRANVLRIWKNQRPHFTLVTLLGRGINCRGGFSPCNHFTRSLPTGYELKRRGSRWLSRDQRRNEAATSEAFGFRGQGASNAPRRRRRAAYRRVTSASYRSYPSLPRAGNHPLRSITLPRLMQISRKLLGRGTTFLPISRRSPLYTKRLPLESPRDNSTLSRQCDYVNANALSAK